MSFLEGIFDGFSQTLLFRSANLDAVDDQIDGRFLFQLRRRTFFPLIQPDKFVFYISPEKTLLNQ